MKKLYTFTAILLIAASLMGQAPISFKYQAVLRDARGNIKAFTATNIIFNILQGSATGTAVYSETHSVTTDGYGLINLALGKGTATNGALSAINWGIGTYFVKISVDGVEMGTDQLLSVPYALHAKTAEKITGGITETDPIFVASPANGISSTNITNWNTAYGWGNHAGLYRPISYVPTWSEITSNPFSFTSLANNQMLRYNTTTSKWGNWTPDFLTSFTETDPIFGAWNKSTGISITASQISDFQTSVTNNTAVLANTAKHSYPSADATKLAGIAAGAEVNVNADWNAANGDAQILNKPTMTGTNTGDQDLSGKVDKVVGKGLSTNDYTTAEQTKVSNLSGTNTGDQTLSGLGGVASNTAITGATNTKITYDSKGLVTSGAAATTADITASTNKNYVTDAQQTVISNTSGTNTGDNSTNTQYSGLVSNATHTGDVTGATALTITDKAVTLSKMNDIATASLLGRSTTGAGVPEVISVGSGLTLSGGTLTAAGSGGTVTSVAMTVPTGLSIGGSPITTSGTLALSLTSGYSIPTTANQTNWDAAYTNRLTSASGTAPLTLTLSSNQLTGSIAAATTSVPGSMSAADKTKLDGLTAVREVADEFSANGAETTFTLTMTPSANSKVKMYINGVRISNAACTWTSGTTATYIPASNGSYTLVAGDRIQIDYFY